MATPNSNIIIKKASGEEQLFSIEKLEQSLVRAGAKLETIQLICVDINNWITPGVTTKMIYSRAFSMLHKEKSSSSLKYHLKQALLEIGPNGYPFEILIGQLFHEREFETEVGKVLEGKCITHEMDVIATKDKMQHLVECKYHKDQGKSVSIQVPLYVHSRINDIINKRQSLDNYKDFSFTGWVITNTRFSLDSINYSRCNNINLLAWDYPANNGLKELLEKYKLYPITILRHLTIKQKQELLGKGWVSIKQLIEKPEWKHELDISNNKYKLIQKEIQQLLG